MARAAKPKVFISYANEDRAYADLVRGYLFGRRDLGTLTDREISPGEQWDQSTSSALDTSDVVILLLSPAFLASKWNLYEAGVALAKDRAHEGKVIPILIDDIDPAALPAPLRRVTLLDGRGADQRSVLREMDELLASETA